MHVSFYLHAIDFWMIFYKIYISSFNVNENIMKNEPRMLIFPKYVFQIFIWSKLRDAWFRNKQRLISTLMYDRTSTLKNSGTQRHEQSCSSGRGSIKLAKVGWPQRLPRRSPRKKTILRLVENRSVRTNVENDAVISTDRTSGRCRHHLLCTRRDTILLRQ